MQIGAMIRKHRKMKNMTQGEMAKRLGVSAPAVNKWESGNSFPDITLLSPIARLLNISIDTLLSHQQELSDDEANKLVEEAVKRLALEPFDDVFRWMRECVEEYPNCYFLILWMTRLFDSKRKLEKVPGSESYDDYILRCYVRVLESENPDLQSAAAESLYYFCMQKKEYAQAEKYLEYFSKENPERKRKQAMICGKTGREQEAYKMYEELLYAGYQSSSMTFHNLYLLALQENDFEKAHMFVGKMRDLARLYEFGEYLAVSVGLELATLEKDESATLAIAQRMLASMEYLYDFTKSPLYRHMEFKEADQTLLPKIKKDILHSLRDEETFGFMRENQKWKELVGFSF